MISHLVQSHFIMTRDKEAVVDHAVSTHFKGNCKSFCKAKGVFPLNVYTRRERGKGESGKIVN